MNFYQIMRVMKITMVLMTCFLVQLSATTLAQKLTIRKQAHHIVDVLKEIRRQSNYDFIYDANALRGLPKVHLEVTNAPIEEVLNQTFKGLPLDYSILSNVVTIRKSTRKVQQTAIAQQLTVRGRVLDGSNRRALQGVSIRIKNSNIGTTTNQNGEFSIQVPSAGQYLIFSFLGYQDQEVQINAEYPNLVIELKPRSDKIEEVRVTVQARVKANTNIAVLEERKKAAIVQDAISAEQIERTASITTTQALQRVTGVTVTDDKFIAVRGLGDRSVIGQLNGARLASSDPDRSAIPLDLVPASLLDNITVYKTVTPDKPADAASGIVELKTKSVPDKLTVEFIAQTGTNSNVGMGGRFNSFWNSNMGLLGTRINNKNLKSDFLNLSKEYPEGLGSIQEMVANSNQTEYGYREVTTIKDTRSDDRAPEWYFSNYRSRTVREFKYMSAIGLTGVSGTYCQLETYVPWSDASGGSVIQTATVNNRIFKRHGSTTAWTAWTEIENVTGSQSRADGALNEAKSYTNAQISVTNGAIALKADRTVTDGLNSRLSSAEQKITPTAIISTVRDSTIEIAGQAVKDIKIGGRNYLLGTSGTTPGGIAASGITMTKNTDGSYTIVAQTVNSNYAQMPYTYADAFAEDVKVGDTITFSCDVKVVSGSSLPSMYFNGSNSYIKMEGEVSSNSFKRVSLTRTLVTTANPVTIHLGFQNAPGTFVIRNFKIEKGNKATEWSAAPEDLEGEISDIGTRITNAESSITQQAGLIATKVGQTEVTASINGAVANIQVGGRNIIRLSNSGSQFFGGYMGSTLSKINNSVSVPEWGATDANRVVSSGGTNTLKATYAILAPKTGETLSISGWFMNNSTTDDLVIHSNLGARTETLGPGVAKRVVFEAIEGNSYESVQFQARSTDPSNNVDFTWWRLQAEKGNKATDWSPAPEDADAEITGLKTRVSSAETTITQNTDAINLRATKSEVTTQVNSARTDAINTASSDATAKANSAQNNAVSSAKTYTDGQVTITNTAINLKAVKSITDGLTTRMNSAEAKITADAINLTVKAQTQAIANQASAQTFANGRMLYTDPAFVSGANGMVQYPSTVGTTMTRVNDQTDSPTKNNIAYKFLHTAMADSNRCSLVRWANQSRANAVFVTRIVAKLPVGWRIQDAHNSYGDSANRSVTWLTPTLGTGMYEEYVLKLVCGNTGTFSSINHFDLRKVDASTPTPTAANPIESYIAWATVYDMSEVYNKPDEEEIKAGISIAANSINIFGKSLSLAGKVTFSSLDSSTQGTINSASSNASSAVSTANSANNAAGSANLKADSTISTANTANTNASNAISTANSANSTAGTANSNASTALSTANTAKSTADSAKTTADGAIATLNGWKFATTTEIDGAKIRTGTITADKIDTDNLISRVIRTSEGASRLSINELNDGQFKVRHTNGQVAIQIGLVGGIPKILFYDSSGTKIWEGGTNGIVYVNDVPESWITTNLFFMDSISSATETLTSTKISAFKSKIKLNSSGSSTSRQMGPGNDCYLYSEGMNATSGSNKQYAGYHTSQVKSLTNWLPNGWYTPGNTTLFSDGPGTGTYSATVFKVFNGQVQDDYVIIGGIS